jgi:nickel-dependent lactate racemase
MRKMNKKICPICGNENKCAHANNEDPYKCWCMDIKIPEKIIEKLQEAKVTDTGGCFCKACVKKFMEKYN